MRTYVYLLLLLLVSSCAPSRFVEPLDKKEFALGGNLGGPLISFAGVPISVPLSSIEGGYGLDTNLTIHAGLHTTSMFFGNFQIDGGVTYQFLEQQKYLPSLSVSPAFNFIIDLDDGQADFWPMLDVNAFWNYGNRRNYFYLGVNNYFELSSTMANDLPQERFLLFSPQVGHVIKGKNRAWELSLELKLIAPNLESANAFVSYTGITGNRGATGVYIGFRKLLGRKKK
ncbi:MAG: hypothetical protein MK066_01100 [Crocinitomicaceae bacterium]|nr:hypothetical protein [Crocinitomicaceae bacterium]